MSNESSGKSEEGIYISPPANCILTILTTEMPPGSGRRPKQNSKELQVSIWWEI